MRTSQAKIWSPIQPNSPCLFPPAPTKAVFDELPLISQSKHHHGVNGSKLSSSKWIRRPTLLQVAVANQQSDRYKSQQ
jgi:hypothetical protein